MAINVESALKVLKRKSPKEIVQEHLPPAEILKEYRHPSSIDRQIRAEEAKNRPGSIFVATLFAGKFVWVPEGHPIARQSTVTSPANKDYPTGCFEGLSRYGDALTLFIARMKRLERSLLSRHYRENVNLEQFAQIIALTAEINTETTSFDNEGNLVRAYGRPTVGFDEAPIGIGIDRRRRMYQAVGFSRMEQYLETRKPLIVVASNRWKRNHQLDGKHSDSYGRASVHHTIARDLGADEAIYLGGVTENRTSRFRRGEIVDGVGEEVLFRVGRTFIVSPLDNGRLGGTSLAHFQDYTARDLGCNVKTDVVTVDDVAKGNIEGMYLIGNAVELSQIEIIWHFDKTPSKGQRPRIITLPNIKAGKVSTEDQKICNFYSRQLWGKESTANPDFRTIINLSRGVVMKQELMKHYPGWFTE